MIAPEAGLGLIIRPVCLSVVRIRVSIRVRVRVRVRVRPVPLQPA